MALLGLRFHNSFHSRIKEASSNGQWHQVLSQYYEVRNSGVLGPGNDHSILFPPIFKACTKLRRLNEAASAHSSVIKQGYESFTSVGNSIADFYMKCGTINSALNAFTCISTKDSVSWNVVIHGCVEGGASVEGLQLFRKARISNFVPNVSTLVLVLKAYRDVRAFHEGYIIHGFLIHSGFYMIVSVQNSLLSLYADFGHVKCAQRLFDEMPLRDVISWSVMIAGYVQNEASPVALRLFREMCSSGTDVEPDELTCTSILKACTNMGDIDIGRLMHGYVVSRGFESDAFVINSLVDVYSKCTDVSSAFKVFDEMPQKNIVSWNSMLYGFVTNGCYAEAVRLFDSMVEGGYEADEFTLVNLLQLWKTFMEATHCKSIHCQVIRRGFDSNERVVNSLIDAYAKCNLIELAWMLFIQMDERDLISWSTMIAAFSHSGKPDEAISLFHKMILREERFNLVTMLSLLDACSLSAEVRRSRCAHGLAVRSGLAKEVEIGTALLDMYSKCGAINASRRVFDQMIRRSVVSWSAMISAYGMNGRGFDALALLDEMNSTHDLKPNAVTLLSVLSACSHSGLVEEGLSCFENMAQQYGVEPGPEHYSCMIDMLARAGDLYRAAELIEKIPEGVNLGPSAWSSILSACRSFGNGNLSGEAASRVLEFEPMNSAGYVLASTFYAKNGQWSDAARMRKLVKEKGVRMMAGYSLVYLEDRAFRFLAGEIKSNPHFEEIEVVVDRLHSCIRMNL
ncbi:hypothetical protein Scep_000120 [Stephania cephalantha]|uniref:Pentatricopeptide repeat-containing protein n=1 Tax=Stephania cephalantha TaxID=152367 RepID=A0AAP0L963_9MAGN